jgi:hypothetical protein
MPRAQLIRQLVLDSQYVIDEQLVAAAILARGATRHLIPGGRFRNDVRRRAVRSFRPSSQVRSFLPCNLSTSIERRAVGARRRLI